MLSVRARQCWRFELSIHVRYHSNLLRERTLTPSYRNSNHSDSTQTHTTLRGYNCTNWPSFTIHFYADNGSRDEIWTYRIRSHKKDRMEIRTAETGAIVKHR